MSKSEDLLEDIDRDLGDCNKAPDCSYFHNRMIDLIAASHAEGVAEGEAEDEDDSIERVAMTIAYEKGKAAGAEQERERIVRGSQRFPQGDDVSDSDYITTDYATKIDFAAVADCELFIIPASLLAPKEKP